MPAETIENASAILEIVSNEGTSTPEIFTSDNFTAKLFRMRDAPMPPGEECVLVMNVDTIPQDRHVLLLRRDGDKFVKDDARPTACIASLEPKSKISENVFNCVGDSLLADTNAWLKGDVYVFSITDTETGEHFHTYGPVYDSHDRVIRFVNDELEWAETNRDDDSPGY